MAYLRNQWYCAAWAGEISRTPLARTLLGEKLVLYRKSDGGVAAIGNVCPHRFAPLHVGTLIDDTLSCAYHGLRFGPNGACELNPHGDIIPPALRVAAYPVVERHGAAWIWMGDAAAADQDTIPQLLGHGEAGWRTVEGRISVPGAFELVADNLLDLSHTQYLHKLLTMDVDDQVTRTFDVRQDGNRLTTLDLTLNVGKFGFVEFVWPDGPDRVDCRGGIRWDPPANMLLKVDFAAAGAPAESGVHGWGAELVTPESETTCHYFWSFARDYRLEDEELDQALGQAISGVFTGEDAWMIGLVQENMGCETDLLAMNPVILPTDKAAVRARRILRQLKTRESDEALHRAALAARTGRTGYLDALDL